MDWTTLSLIVSAIVLIAQYIWKVGTRGYDLFELQGIPFIKPLPFVGTQLPMFRRTVTIADFVKNAFNAHPNSRIVGMFDRKKPVYMLKDPELIKQITVKDFEHFLDRQDFMEDLEDPLMGNNLAQLTGQKWKDMRTTLSPVFTGSKMRQMFDLLPEIGIQMAAYFRNCSDEDRIVEMKDVFGRFALDGIASTNFGVKVDSFKEKENHFTQKVKAMLDFQSLQMHLKFLLLFFCPRIFKLFTSRIISEKKTRFFENLVRDTERTREEQGIFRPDLINLLMQVKKGQLHAQEESHEGDIGFATVQEANLGTITKRKWSDDELMAQAFIFFFAGFETVSTAGSLMVYEVALNPDVQKKLIAEIDAVDAELQGKNLTYEILQRMKYMDMVVSEGLRVSAPADMVDRVCVKDYTMKNDNGNEFTIKKGSVIAIPIVALHSSEKYFENPEKFDPERFSDENKHNIVNGAYLPFGLGPRNCIGSRFALMELKAALYYLLKDFTVETTAKTEIPLKMMKGFTKGSENGIWLKLEPRKK